MYEEMKEKFKTGDYICLTIPKFAGKNLDYWMVSEYPNFRDDFTYKLIHKKHKDILYEFLEDDSVEIEVLHNPKKFGDDNCYLTNSGLLLSFIDGYSEDREYRLKLTNEDKQEISNQIDEISLNEQIEKQLTFKVSSSTILVGTGKDITKNIGNHLTKDYEYEIIIKQLKP